MRFVTSPDSYSRIRRQLDRHLLLEAALPGAVLRHRPRTHTFFEFDEVFRESFWDVMYILAAQSGDDTVVFSVIDPDPEEYFYREFGYFPAAEAPVGFDTSRIIDVLCSAPDDSPADSLMHNSHTIAIASSFGGMVAWADRSLGLGLLALFDRPEMGVGQRLPEGFPFADVHRAIEIIRPAFVGSRVPDLIRNELLRNYG